MKTINLLEFLNNTKELYTLNYAVCEDELVNFLDLMTEDEQFTAKIDLGIIYLEEKNIGIKQKINNLKYQTFSNNGYNFKTDNKRRRKHENFNFK